MGEERWSDSMQGYRQMTDTIPAMNILRSVRVEFMLPLPWTAHLLHDLGLGLARPHALRIAAGAVNLRNVGKLPGFSDHRAHETSVQANRSPTALGLTI